MSLALSATTVKSWFQYRCERKTRYAMMSSDDRETAAILRDVLKAPWAALGTEFERRIVSRLARFQRVLRPAPTDEYLTQAQSKAFLEGDRSETLAHQVVVDPCATLSMRLKLPRKVTIRRCYVDLLREERDSDSRWLVPIDIKATQHATPFHKAQVAFYGLMLESLLAEWQVDSRISPVAEIWCLPDGSSGEEGEYRVEAFKLEPYTRLVTDFFANHVPEFARRTVTRGRDDTFFHLYFKCEQCEYLRHCRQTIAPDLAPAKRDISAVPGMSHESKRAAQRLGIRKVGQLADAHGLRRVGAASWNLSRRADALVARAQALLDDAPRRMQEASSYLMPPRVDVGIYIVVDVDPVENTLAAIGYLRDGVYGERHVVETLAEGTRKRDECAALCKVMGSLLSDLEAIDRTNSALESDDPDQLHAHLFLFEPSEALSLQEAVGRNLEDPVVRGGLLNLVRIFPPDDVVPEPEFRGVHHLPATALRSVVEQLFALPVMVAYDLRQVTQCLAGTVSDYGTPYRPPPQFERPFSSRLGIDVCRMLRAGTIESTAVASDVEARLKAMRDLTRWLLSENAAAEARSGDHAFLRLRKRPFQFQETFDPLDVVDLDMLRAFELLENRAGLLDALVELARPWRQRCDRARCIPQMTLKRSGRNQFGYWMLFDVPPESRESDLNSGNLDLILTDDNPDIRLNPPLWPCFEVRIAREKPEYGQATLLVNVAAEVYEGSEFDRLLRESGDNSWYLDRTFKDFTTQRAADFIAFLGGQAE